MTAYPIPAAALDDRLAWTGTSGSGKTYNAGAGVEALMHAMARVIIIDPLDVWWGLRLAPDGQKHSGFKPVIFGGPHGDLPLNERGGALLGETTAKMRESCIISLADFKSGAAERRFMLNFLEALYRNANGEPVHLVFDEADLWAPQLILDKDGDATKLLGMMQTIVRRGRVKGFIPWLITQRPAAISKGVLSQVDGLMAFKLTSSQDRDAIGGWIKGQADAEVGKSILASLPGLQLGQGVVWVPGRGILETAAFPAKATFDSSRTPKRGEVVRTAALRPLDLGALKDRLAAVEEEAKANDPRALRAEIAQLKAAAAKAPAAVQAGPSRAEIEAAEKRGYLRGHAEGYAEGFLQLKGFCENIRRAMTDCAAAVEQQLQEASKRKSPKPTTPAMFISSPSSEAAKMNMAARQPEPAPPRPAGRAAELGAKAKVLEALAWWKAAGFPSIDRRRACLIGGWSPKASTFGVYVSQLTAAGLVEIPKQGELALTPEGEAAAPTPDFTGSVVDAARGLLSPAENKVFDLVVAAYPEARSRGELADALGLSRNASTLGVYVSKISSFGFVETGGGVVRAADWLFPGARA